VRSDRHSTPSRYFYYYYYYHHHHHYYDYDDYYCYYIDIWNKGRSTCPTC
jgi:hypothetical protein